MSMLRLVLAASAAAFLMLAAPVAAEPLQAARLDQRLGEKVPLALTFRDETGRRVRLGDYFGEEPVILTFAYFGCSQLCTDVLAGLSAGVQGLTAPHRVLTVSIDSQDTPQAAALRRRVTPGASNRRWHFLTGGKPAIRALTAACGFHFAYDRSTHQFAHPAGAMVLTPGGRLSAYFYGLEFPPARLDAALEQAASERVGVRVPELLLRCFHDVFASGRHGRAIDLALKLACALTVAAVAVGIGLAVRGERRRAKEGGL